MNALEEQLIRALAEDRVTSRTKATARRYLEKRERASAAAAARACTTASVAHHAAVRRQEERAEEAAIHAMHDAVWAENLRLHPTWRWGACDCGCGKYFRHDREGELDHWIERSQGGEHTRENGWRLRSECHDAKTNNRPDRAWWNEARKIYCARAGIPFVPRRERS